MLDCWCTDVAITLVNTTLANFSINQDRGWLMIPEIWGATAVPSVLCLGPAHAPNQVPCTAGKLWQRRQFPGPRGRGRNGLCHSLKDKAANTKSHGIDPEQLPHCFSVWAHSGGAAGSQAELSQSPKTRKWPWSLLICWYCHCLHWLVPLVW